ncbi:sorbitol dehydrogenase-like [Elysia marginata]|uniref:Sorbitol dehydrogenase n=1 Tax=Elysia marginata TaxID=1093978 RepID=A0AAV4GCZ1_9GAST|nr:sorbitol dehydrogenase-like [Elysia marginata]
MGPVGICGSDIKYWTHGYCSGVFVLRAPMVLGHEGAGTVVQTGSKVKNLQVGDRVAIEPGVPCLRCRVCREGRYNLCPDMQFCATPPIHGNLCRLYKHPAAFCHRLPERVDLEQGALVEPLAVAVHACRRGGVRTGCLVLVCGADIDDGRLAFAKEIGADYVINVRGLEEPIAAQQIITTAGSAPDVTIECSGSDYSMTLGIHATHPGGSIVQVGRGSQVPSIPLTIAATKEVDIKGVFRYANCYETAISLINSGQLPNLKQLISHRYPLAETEVAFKTAMSRDAGAIKVIIDCDQ